MELKDRILKIMATEALSASVFADRIGVQRSSISHILSGRNKPSLEFLQKIIQSFPAYRLEWLIMGEGDIKKQNAPINKPDLLQANTDLFTNKQPKEDIATIKEEKSELDLNKAEKKIITNITEQENSLATKTVEQIIICYSDKTFTHYKPE